MNTLKVILLSTLQKVSPLRILCSTFVVFIELDINYRSRSTKITFYYCPWIARFTRFHSLLLPSLGLLIWVRSISFFRLHHFLLFPLLSIPVSQLCNLKDSWAIFQGRIHLQTNGTTFPITVPPHLSNRVQIWLSTGERPELACITDRANEKTARPSVGSIQGETSTFVYCVLCRRNTMHNVSSKTARIKLVNFGKDLWMPENRTVEFSNVRISVFLHIQFTFRNFVFELESA